MELDRLWFPFRRPRPNARVRLFCFPHAGGGASAYRQWADLVPEWVEICAVQLPGRETRFGERPFEALAPLLDAVMPAVRLKPSLPYALFGHSLGALVAFELARRLSAEGAPPPRALFVSGCEAPQGLRPSPRQAVLREDLVRHLRELGGTPDELLDHPEWMALLEPVLQADFNIFGRYHYQPGSLIRCPLHAFGGETDSRVLPQALEGWKELTSSEFTTRVLPGGHFFPATACPQLLDSLGGHLSRLIP